MLEIESKFAIGSFDDIARTLERWGAIRAAAHVESDHYYNAPDRDFRQTDEALRLRRVGAENRLTYKGPKQPGPTKTRTEIEVPLQEGNAAAGDCLRLLESLNYRPTAIVEKTRTAYTLTRDGFEMQVCLDEVKTLGRFVEVEIVTPPERRDAAQAVILAVSEELNLKHPEPRSYLRMVLEAAGSDL